MIVVSLIFLCINSNAQETVTKFSFESGGRGFEESIIVRLDSTFYHKHSLFKKINIDSVFLTEKGTWEKLLNSIAPYKLAELKNLPAPSHYIDIDGAMGSQIEIETNLHKYFCGSFDDINPDDKLKLLLGIMLELK